MTCTKVLDSQKHTTLLMKQALHNPNHRSKDYQNNKQRLSNVSNWLGANKLSLNVKKTELVIFRPRKMEIDHSFKFKLDGKRLVPTHSVKYLGVIIGKHLPWNKQIAQIVSK